MQAWPHCPNRGAPARSRRRRPRTPTHRTGGADGVEHRIHPHLGPNVVVPSGTLARGVELKSDGQYIVLPPSDHASGNRYSLLDDREPAMLPRWVIELARITR